MKKKNIIYWVVTGIVAAYMVFSALPDALLQDKAVEFMQGLGYPDYFTRFIGIAKLLGVAGILLPLPLRLKDWAYAGLVFDLVGALYSVTYIHGFDISTVIFIGGPIALLIYSNVLMHKRATLRAS
ncbi:MAG TPA: DoxX family protein [Chitinophagales bacterium]|nr:DoxX family protein [Chitinophagales bacterium]HNK98334.1 DoxX family protein [Chitinophagales bacterium]